MVLTTLPQASEGESRISTIEKAVGKLSELGLDELKVKDFKNQLQAVNLHLKNYFKTHLISKSTCIEHCMQYALSDSSCDHEHSETYSSCHQVKNVTTEIAHCLEGVHCEANVKEEIQHDEDLSCEKIVNWRNQCMYFEQPLRKSRIYDHGLGNEIFATDIQRNSE